jgi:hypothetical protein
MKEGWFQEQLREVRESLSKLDKRTLEAMRREVNATGSKSRAIRGDEPSQFNSKY